MCQGARDYADIIHDKLKEHGYYDDEGQFDVTDQVSLLHEWQSGQGYLTLNYPNYSVISLNDPQRKYV